MTGGTASRRDEVGQVKSDLVVLTVLREEYAAVLGCLAAPAFLRGSKSEPNTYAWQLGAIDSPRYEAPFRIVVGMGTPTTTYGALAAIQAIRLFDPRYIAFVGVAGGFHRDGQCHGDVAVSSAVVAYEYGKVDTGGFAPRSDFTYRCDGGLVRAAEAVASKQWWRENENRREPRVRTGLIASGDKVIDDPEEAFFAAVAKVWPRLLAVEMEGAGVAAAVQEAHSQGHPVRFVLVRGISDMPHAKGTGENASTGERDSWKSTAARNAARFLMHLVTEAWPEQPRDDGRASEGEPVSAGGSGPAAALASGSVEGGAASSPARAREEIRALVQRLQDAYARRKRLLDVGAATDVLNREIVDLKRQLREGGQLRAGDWLGDGRYLLVDVLGRGGFAVVWKAKDEVSERHVAIKILHPNLAGDTLRRERFYRGARAMRTLQHPAVVRVLEPEGEDDGFYYFVMELVCNGTLHDAAVGKRLSVDTALGHILRVGEALAEAHAQRMIHRDIKPQNILLDEQFEAKLTDFDLVGAKDTTGGTRTGAMGTVIYAAPECLQTPQAATERADVFGLGMTAIFCLAGKALTLSMLRDEEPTIAQLPCSDAVKQVLRRAVAWKPEARYADASAMVSALRAAMPRETSMESGVKVVDGDAGSGAAVGRTVESGIVSNTPSAPRVPMPLSLRPPSADGSPIEPLIPTTSRKRSIARKLAIGALVVSVFGSMIFRLLDRRDQPPPGAVPSLPAVTEWVTGPVGQGAAAGGARAENDMPNPQWATASGTDKYGRWAAFVVEGVRQQMRWIPSGTFLMGSPKGERGRLPDEGEQHMVKLSHGYWLGETPVTQALWMAVMGENPSLFRGDTPNELERPVERVSWDDAQLFLDRLNQRVSGLAARLPTEAEWERACRAETLGATWVGELSGKEREPELEKIAWYGSKGVSQTQPVGGKMANPYGLYDMLGNVWEWCADVYDPAAPAYSALLQTDPLATGPSSYRVSRGGSWFSEAKLVRAATRDAHPRYQRYEYVGFRLAGGQVSGHR